MSEHTSLGNEVTRDGIVHRCSCGWVSRGCFSNMVASNLGTDHREANRSEFVAGEEVVSMSSHQSARAKSVTWLTPPEWIKALGPFDLDPCCPSDMPWKTAATMLTEANDGLFHRWDGLAGRVWLNPPFGQEWPRWVEKLADHGDGIALIPARTETKEFYRLVWDRADAVCFVKGRPHFHREDGTRAPFNSGAPIALVAYGAGAVEKLTAAALGVTVVLRTAIRTHTEGER